MSGCGNGTPCSSGAETATQNWGGSCKAKSGQRAIARCDLGGVAPCGGIAHAPPIMFWGFVGI